MITYQLFDEKGTPAGVLVIEDTKTIEKIRAGKIDMSQKLQSGWTLSEVKKS